MNKFYDFINPRDISVRDLRKMVARMTKNANRRIGNIERITGSSKAIRQAARRMGYKKGVSGIRFDTNISKLSDKQLVQAFYNLREFLSSDTSTVRGAVIEKKRIEKIRYDEAVKRGFTGDAERFRMLSDKLWEEVNANRLSSNIAFYIIESNAFDLYTEVINMDAKERNKKRKSLLYRAVQRYKKR